MRHTAKAISTATAVAALLGTLAFSLPSISVAKDASAIAQGKKLAFNKKKGNCLACHEIKGGKLPGNIGPSLSIPGVAMKDRYPDKSKLRAQIYDARGRNPNTIMPPFGAHEIISEAELDNIVEFIYSL
ncbi:Sulfur oxidation protein SoxX [hydrothermal vent metagenome]|uniref:Sulfur oxidation protein SoxX n=1 Tax=hydrothermal vent metagenome TaxID=652676 RepID=A0A3B0X9U0_9ZZZZ